jgi:hypothetical protein
MNKLLRLIVFFGIGLALCTNVSSQEMNFQFRDTSGFVDNFIDIPIYANSTFTGKGVIAYSLQFSFSSSILSPQGVVTAGTITSQFGTPSVNNNVSGQITIAGAGSSALTGTGIFIFLRFKILASGGTGISSTGSASNYFNEGEPVLTYTNACSFTGIQPATISVSPFNAIILKGATEQFSASAGSEPYSWNVTNPAVSTISTGGLLTGAGIGITKVKATDANNNSGFSGNIDIRGYKLTLPDTTGTLNSFISIPVTTTNLTGLNVLSGTLKISLNAAAITNIQIETINSLLQNFSPPSTSVSGGNIQVSFAGSSPIDGSGVLFWIKGKLSNLSGGSSGLTFTEVVFNEDLLAVTKNGSVSYSSPSIAISPNSGQLVFGDSLQLQVTGTGITPPLTWSVSNPSLATINSSGYLKVIQSGQTTVSVMDASGATAVSGIFQLYDTYLKIADTSAIPGAQIEIPVRIKSLPPGQGVLSLEGKIMVSNTALFSFTEIVNIGTPSASFSTSYSLGADYIRFSMAGVTPIPGNSVLFKLKGTVKATATEGSSTSLTVQDLLLNEGVPRPFIQNGSIEVSRVYTFIGTGNWFDPANWKDNMIPPNLSSGTNEIIIDPPGDTECVLDLQQQSITITRLTVKPGKRLRIIGNLIVQN